MTLNAQGCCTILRDLRAFMKRALLLFTRGFVVLQDNALTSWSSSTRCAPCAERYCTIPHTMWPTAWQPCVWSSFESAEVQRWYCVSSGSQHRSCRGNPLASVSIL